MDIGIGWKQRFPNYEKALNTLEEALSRDELSKLEKAGVITVEPAIHRKRNERT